MRTGHPGWVRETPRFLLRHTTADLRLLSENDLERLRA
jgi:hypothetical protein